MGRGREDAKSLSEEKVRAKIASYRCSADAARRQANELDLPEARASYLRMAEGFDRLIAMLEEALKQNGSRIQPVVPGAKRRRPKRR